MTISLKTIMSATVVVTSLALAPAALADETEARADAVYGEIQQMFGAVPSFIKAVPKAALPGLWQQTKDLEMSDKTALPPKTKALISLAVAAQIPCQYCIWIDANTARQHGASDQEIAEAVAMAGLTRNWSTMFYGLQVDFDVLKKELGGS